MNHAAAALVLDDGLGSDRVTYPVTQVYSSGSGSARLVRGINDWIEERRGRVMLQDNRR